MLSFFETIRSINLQDLILGFTIILGMITWGNDLTTKN